MITQDERDTLNQWYADYSANNAKPMDYVTWLEYMLVHRTNLLQQSAAYSDYLEEALNQVHDYLYEKGDLIAALNVIGALEMEAE